MKKYGLIILSLALVLMLCACGKGGDKAGGSDSKNASAATAESNDKNVGETDSESTSAVTASLNDKVVGETAAFGNSEQDSDQNNGTESVEWGVQDVKSDNDLQIPQIVKAGGEKTSFDGTYDAIAIVYKNAILPYMATDSLTISGQTVQSTFITNSDGTQETGTFVFEDGTLIVYREEIASYAIYATQDSNYLYCAEGVDPESPRILLRSRDAETDETSINLINIAPERVLTAAGVPQSEFDRAFENGTLELTEADKMALAPADYSLIIETVTAIAQDNVFISMVPEGQSGESGIPDMLYGRTWVFDPSLSEGDRDYSALRISNDGKTATLISTNPLRYNQRYALKAYNDTLACYDEVRSNLLDCIDCEQEAWNAYCDIAERCNALAARMGKETFDLLPRVSLDEDYVLSESESAEETEPDAAEGDDYGTLCGVMKSANKRYQEVAKTVKTAQASLADAELALEDAYRACFGVYGYDSQGDRITRGEEGAIDPAFVWMKVDPNKYRETAAEVFPQEYMEALIELRERDFLKWLVSEERYMREYAAYLGIDAEDEDLSALVKEQSTTKSLKRFRKSYFEELPLSEQQNLKWAYFDETIEEVLRRDSDREKLYNEMFVLIGDRMDDEARDELIYTELNGILSYSDTAYEQAVSASERTKQARKNGKDSNTSKKISKRITQIQELSEQVSTVEETLELNRVAEPERVPAEKLTFRNGRPVPDSAELMYGKSDPNHFETEQAEPLTMELGVKARYDAEKGILSLTGGMQDRTLTVKMEISGFDDLEATKKQSIAEENSAKIPQIVSISPTRNSGFAVLDGESFSFYEGEYHVLYTSKDKGVEDQYGNMARIYEDRDLTWLIGAEGVSYSHDGRYAVICNYNIAMVYADFRLDPVVYDLATGERILTETFANKMSLDNCGVITNALFSPDDKYLYYTVYGSNESGVRSTRLYRYEIESDATELCATLPTRIGYNYVFADYPGLALGKDGAFYVLTDNYSADVPQCIARIEEVNDKWIVSGTTLNLSLPKVMVKELHWSETSGKAMYVFEMGNSSNQISKVLTAEEAAKERKLSRKPISLFNCFNLDATLAGVNDYWAIDAQSLQPVRVDEELFQPVSVDTNLDALLEVWNSYTLIDQYGFTPDGEYVLLCVGRTADKHMIAVRLCDMSAREIRFPYTEVSTIGFFSVDWYGNALWNSMGAAGYNDLNMPTITDRALLHWESAE